MSNKTLNRTKHITAFYVEVIGLIAAFLLVLVIIVRCFGGSARVREQAGALNDGVYLAKSAAEAVTAAGDMDEMTSLLLCEDAVESKDESTLQVRYSQSLKPDADGVYRLKAQRGKGKDGVIPYRITVEYAEDGSEIYSLDTAVFTGRGTE